MQVGRHGDEWNGQCRKFAGHLSGHELFTKFLGVDLRGLAEPSVQKIAKIAGARRHQAAPRLAPVVREGDDVVTDVLTAHARGVSGPNERADRGAGDRGRLHAHLVERLDNRDMGEPARAAAAKCQGKTFHAPAWEANSKALAASGRTSCALLAASALVAVPSRTLPAIPCIIAARRKKL